MEPTPFKKLGAIPYSRTGDELEVGSAAPTISPQSYNDPAFFTTPILMQSQSPECGGYSAAFALAYLLQLGDKLSGSFAYAYEKTVDGVPNVEGTTIAAIGQTAEKAGTCLLPLFPDDGAAANPNGAQTPYSVATAEAISDAATRAGWIPLFLRDLSWAGIQAGIAQYKAVILEVRVGQEWWTNAQGETSWAAGDVLPIRPPKAIIDSHFIVAGGEINPAQIHFANSWSESWGDNGFGYFGQDYVPYIQNAIVLYKAPPSVTTVVNHPTLTPTEKNSIIQQIITDIQEVAALIEKEL